MARQMDNPAHKAWANRILLDRHDLQLHMRQRIVEPDARDPVAGDRREIAPAGDTTAKTRISVGAAAARKGLRAKLSIVGDGR